MSSFIIIIISLPLLSINNIKFYKSKISFIGYRSKVLFTSIRFIKPYIGIKFLSTSFFLVLFIELVIHFNNYIYKVIK